LLAVLVGLFDHVGASACQIQDRCEDRGEEDHAGEGDTQAEALLVLRQPQPVAEVRTQWAGQNVTAAGDWILELTGWGPGTSVLLPAALIVAIMIGWRLGA